MTYNQEFDLFSSHRSTEDELYPDLDSTSLENNLYPPYGSPESDLYPDQRRTKQEWNEIEEFVDHQDLQTVEKRRIINYFLDIDNH